MFLFSLCLRSIIHFFLFSLTFAGGWGTKPRGSSRRGAWFRGRAKGEIKWTRGHGWARLRSRWWVTRVRLSPSVVSTSFLFVIFLSKSLVHSLFYFSWYAPRGQSIEPQGGLDRGSWPRDGFVLLNPRRVTPRAVDPRRCIGNFKHGSGWVGRIWETVFFRGSTIPRRSLTRSKGGESLLSFSFLDKVPKRILLPHVFVLLFFSKKSDVSSKQLLPS